MLADTSGVTQRIIVMRHGERRDSAPEAPPEVDPPLTEAGKKEVATAAAKLKKLLGESDARNLVIVVSPFMRTLETAEALQYYGIGTDRAVVVDNTLCEVFGPIRIKSTVAPRLPAQVVESGFGGLPGWGESIEAASERYVENFLRNGDKFGWPALSASAASMHREGSDMPITVPEAVVAGNRLKKQRTPKSRVSVVSGGSETSCGPQDLLLVTHGDALSAILSHFYPSRTVYEAQFLSFICLQRYGSESSVYHLADSSGVHWIVEGVDREPVDPIRMRLEELLHPPPSDDTMGDCSDDEEDSSTVPFSINRRVNTNRNRGPSEPQPATTTTTAAPDQQPAKNTRLPARTRRPPHASSEQPLPEARGIRPSMESSPRGGSHDVVGRVSQSTVGLSSESSRRENSQKFEETTNSSGERRAARNGNGTSNKPRPKHPNGCEGCERIRPPSGTPAQSSDDTILIDKTHGHFPSSSTCCQREQQQQQPEGTAYYGERVEPPLCSGGIRKSSCGSVLSSQAPTDTVASSSMKGWLERDYASTERPASQRSHEFGFYYNNNNNITTTSSSSDPYHSSLLTNVYTCLLLRALTALSQVPALWLWTSRTDATIYVVAVCMVECAEIMTLILQHVRRGHGAGSSFLESLPWRSPQTGTAEQLHSEESVYGGSRTSETDMMHPAAAAARTTLSGPSPPTAAMDAHPVTSSTRLGYQLLVTATKALLIALVAVFLSVVFQRGWSFLDTATQTASGNLGAVLAYLAFWIINIARGTLESLRRSRVREGLQ